LGFKAWSFDPAQIQTGTATPTAGKPHVVTIRVAKAESITNIVMSGETAGDTLTSGQCFAALYQGGSKKGVTASQSTAWATAGLYTMALASGPFTVTAGLVQVVFWFNGTTGPAFGRGTTGYAANAGLGATSSRYGVTADSSITTTGPATLGAISAEQIAWWVGLS
jgi:hypothetical protein